MRIGLLEFNLRLYDLSVGGCLIDSLAEITREHTVRLRITLPDGNTVMVRGQVTLPPRDIGYAVRFVDVDSRTRAMIRDALEYAELERTGN